jgi:hypothetical protein
MAQHASLWRTLFPRHVHCEVRCPAYSCSRLPMNQIVIRFEREDDADAFRKEFVT